MNKKIFFLAIIIAITIPQYTMAMDQYQEDTVTKTREIAEKKRRLEEAKQQLKVLGEKRDHLNQQQKRLRPCYFEKKMKKVMLKIKLVKTLIKTIREVLSALRQERALTGYLFDSLKKENENPSQRTIFGELGNGGTEEASAATPQCNKCNICGKTERLRQCSLCQNVYYCSQGCQREDW